MAYSLQPTTSEALDLPTFVDHIKATVDFSSEESLLQAAEALKALANNRTFLSEWLNTNLSSELLLPDSGFIGGVFVVAKEEGFIIRANVWSPPRGNTLDSKADNIANSYLNPHDHNFSFLTIGYLGSGYRTDIYEYEPTRTRGYEGELVDLTFLEATSLPEGKVMLYRESRDVHVQYHPSEYSMSLNILPVGRLHNTQRFFDLSTGRIVRAHVYAEYARLAFFCRIAGLLGDEETYEFLEAIARDSSRDGCSRWYALESCAHMRDDLSQSILERASHDADPYISNRAAARLVESERR